MRGEEGHQVGWLRGMPVFVSPLVPLETPEYDEDGVRIGMGQVLCITGMTEDGGECFVVNPLRWEEFKSAFYD